MTTQTPWAHIETNVCSGWSDGLSHPEAHQTFRMDFVVRLIKLFFLPSKTVHTVSTWRPVTVLDHLASARACMYSSTSGASRKEARQARVSEPNSDRRLRSTTMMGLMSTPTFLINPGAGGLRPPAEQLAESLKRGDLLLCFLHLPTGPDAAAQNWRRADPDTWSSHFTLQYCRFLALKPRSNCEVVFTPLLWRRIRKFLDEFTSYSSRFQQNNLQHCSNILQHLQQDNMIYGKSSWMCETR